MHRDVSFQPFDEKCRLDKPTGDVISLQYHFDTLAPNIQTIGSVRLPAPSDGYSGPGACVDEIGPNNCITLETNPAGCPYEPQHCDDVIKKISCQILSLILLKVIPFV